MGIGPWEIAVLLIVLVIIFGVGRLSQVGGALGKSVREFRGAVQAEPAAARTVAVAPPVICSACQASNLATNRFCSRCGATLGGPPVAAIAASTQTAPSETAPAAAASGVGAPVAAEVDTPVSVAPATVVPTNTCPSCATINPPGQPFCGQCGTGLGTAAA
jgi:sec-independent protein translocase protein TatA